MEGGQDPPEVLGVLTPRGTLAWLERREVPDDELWASESRIQQLLSPNEEESSPSVWVPEVD